MKPYIKKAIKELKDCEKIAIELKNKNDYKKNFLKILYNKAVLGLQTRIIPSHVKNMLLRTTGIKVGRDACIPHYIYFDAYFPELIYLGKGCIVGGDSRVYTHSIKGGKLTLGKVIVGERTLVGGLSTLNPGFKLNKNSILMFASESDKEIPSSVLFAGKPAKLLKEFDKEEIEKYFKPSDGNYKAYYKDFRKKVRGFIKDPAQNYFKIHYNGKRLNAGDDWHKARNVFRIFYNGIIIEITRLLPHCFFKTFLLKMAGVKIGKNVKIGKGCVFDHLFCDSITLEDNVTLENNVYIDGHSYTITQTIFGKTLVKKGAYLKKNSFVATGTTIGENSVLEENSTAERVIPDNEKWGGMPAKFIEKL